MTALPPLAALRRFVPQKGVERCGLCGVQLPPEHQHLLEIAARRVVCACEPCGVLFHCREADGGTRRYQRIGRDVRFLPDFEMNDAQWDALRIPIGLAFFVRSTPHAKAVAFYPSPAGPTEAHLPLDSWSQVEERNAAVREMTPDVEALLVNRIGVARDHFIAPIDRCFELVGLIRTRWRGLGGGEELWRAIERFFISLKEVSNA